MAGVHFLISVNFVLLLLNFSSFGDLVDTNLLSNFNAMKLEGKIIRSELLLLGFHSKTFYDKVASLDCRPSQLIFCCLLLLLSGDVSQNPGPRWKYPCMLCSQPVKINQKGICCDSCDHWFHTKCLNMDARTYNILSNSSCSWICEQCGLPNQTSARRLLTPPPPSNLRTRFLHYLAHLLSC